MTEAEKNKCKAVSLQKILEFAGYTPAYKTSNGLMYYAPWRNETSPSVHVRLDTNRWTDFSDGSGSDTFDLVKRLGYASSFKEAADYLLREFVGKDPDEKCCMHKVASTAITRQTKSLNKVEIISVSSIMSAPLLDYFAGRGIPAKELQRRCKEVKYRIPSGKEYFGVGFLNRRGGYAIRNQYYKGAVGPADITIIPGESRGECIVFEGFTSMMSYEVKNGIISSDVIVLNSVSLMHKALPVFSDYNVVVCALDNDTAGKKATEEIIAKAGVKVVDISSDYSEYNDYNDFLRGIKTEKSLKDIDAILNEITFTDI